MAAEKDLFEGTIPEIEEQVGAYWDKENTFQKSLERTKDGKPFTFYDGPPFATGLPHYGHILASTIKDVVPRFETMRGRFVRRRWGWDCHGLPIEEIVERQLGISGKKQIEEIGIQTFNETCRATVLRFADEWRKMVRRMGRWVEFDNSYKTMDRTYMESVWWGFKKLWDKELVYEGRKVLLYCPRCETPLSNFEVAMDQSYKDITEESVYVKFPISNDQFPNTYFLAWTTTPWTLPGNVALAVGAEMTYVQAKKDGSIYIVAKELAEKALPGGFEILAEMKGSELVGLAYEPLFDIPALRNDKAFKIYAADFVTAEEGTGIVHTAVVYGEDDYKLGVKEGLPIVPLLDEKGVFNADAPELVRGQYFKESERFIKKDLEARGLLLRRASHQHSYPHCWRCGTALFYNAIPAWFINIQKIKPDLLASNEKEVNWFPEHLKQGRYAKSVESAPDWNISRNRYWGNPIPVWKCADCGKPTAVGSIDELKKRAVKKNEIIFARHGGATHNAEDLCGPQDLPEYVSHLTEAGKKEAEAAAQALSGRKIDMIVASPLARIRETVEIIRKHVDAPVEYIEGLREIDCGGLRKHSEWEAISSKEADPFAVPFPGGESHNDAKARYLKVLRQLNAEYEGKTILVVGHGGPLWVLQGALRGLTDKEVMDSPYPATGKTYDFEWSPMPLSDRGEVDLHRPYIDDVVLKCADCGGKARKISEIFDSWVEAGSMPFAEYHYPFENKELFESRYPAQFVAEYIAQTRAWFYVMHVLNLELFGKAPFDNVVTTGTILAEDGSKMSKSKNNYPDPWETVNKYGVDSLRLYLMNSSVMQADNLNFSLKDLEVLHRKVTLLLWNVSQYFLTYAKEGGWEKESGISNLGSGHILDKWISARTKELVRDVTAHMEKYDTVRATRAIEAYIDDLSTWYLRRSRGRADAGFYPAFYAALTTTAKVLAPFMPHLSEAVYLNLTNAFGEGAGSIHLEAWPQAGDLSEEDNKVLAEMALVRADASLGLAIRKKENMPVRQPLQAFGTATLSALSPESIEILKDELNVKSIVSAEGEERHLDLTLTDELRFEGLTRNLERFVQGMRKEQGFRVGESAILAYETSDGEMEKALQAFNREKTYISTIEKGSVPEGGDFEGRAKIEIKKA